jgi:hypothetical protein
MTDFVDAFKVNSGTLAALYSGFALARVVDRTAADGSDLFLVRNVRSSRRAGHSFRIIGRGSGWIKRL